MSGPPVLDHAALEAMLAACPFHRFLRPELVDFSVAEGWIVPGLVDAHCHIGLDDHGATTDEEAEAQAVQDRDGGVLLMGALFGRYPSLLKLYADSGYQGPKFQEGLRKVCHKINGGVSKLCWREGVKRVAA